MSWQPENHNIMPPRLDISEPPAYENCCPDPQLPTYEEVEMEKLLECEMTPRLPVRTPDISIQFTVTDDDLNPCVVIPNPCEVDTCLLGTDYMFLMAFSVSFIFNWLGFLVIMCNCQKVAPRYGALAGLGLSLAELTIILKWNTELTNSPLEYCTNPWLCWLLIAFGFFIFIRTVVQYIHIKRRWRFLSVPEQERALNFY